MQSQPFQTEILSRVASDGFAFIPSFRVQDSDEDAICAIGSIDKLPGLSRIQELKPRESSDSPRNTYSGNFGLGKFPFHSDLAHWPTPPRFLVLRCIKGAKEVKTRLLDSRVLARSVGASQMRRTVVKPRRPLEMSYPLMRLLDKHKCGVECFRWDSIFVVPATSHSKVVCNEVEEWIEKADSVDVVLSNAGDTLVVDNWRMLHSRSPVPLGCEERIILRAYLSHLS